MSEGAANDDAAPNGDATGNNAAPNGDAAPDRGGDAAAPHGRREDSAAGCRSLASDDRDRAKDSDSDRMRFRLACSAEAWTNRAELLDRLEANRLKMNNGTPTDGESPTAQENDDE